MCARASERAFRGKTLWLSARGCIFAAGGCKIPGVRQLAGINNVTSGAQEIRPAACFDKGYLKRAAAAAAADHVIFGLPTTSFQLS